MYETSIPIQRQPFQAVLCAMLLCGIFFLGAEGVDSCTESNSGTLTIFNATGYECLVIISGQGKLASGPYEYRQADGETAHHTVTPGKYVCSYRENTFRSQANHKSTVAEKTRPGKITMTF